MRCYLVKTPTGIKRYASTNADAKTQRDEFMADGGWKKSAIVIEQVDISLAKAELLEFINGLCKEIDDAN